MRRNNQRATEEPVLASTPPAKPAVETIPFDEIHQVAVAYLQQREGYFQRLAAGLRHPQLVRVEFPVHACDPQNWLFFQRAMPRAYWRDRQRSLEVAGAGYCLKLNSGEPTDLTNLFSRLDRWLKATDPGLRFLGGLAFDLKRPAEGLWHSFGTYHFWVPLLECGRREGRHYFAVNLLLDPGQSKQSTLKQALKLLSSLSSPSLSTSRPLPDIQQREDLPDLDGWRRQIQSVLTAIQQERLEKLVLARQTRFIFQHPPDGLSLFARLAQANPDAYQFYFQLNTHTAFLGCSPERLFRRSGRFILTEAVAGTRPRGQSPTRDRQLAHQLLHSQKDRHEHFLVIKSILQGLETLCEKVESQEEPTVLKLARVQHLASRFEGLLKPGISDADILATLHPTPAVGGFPTESALEALRRLEPFYRGWYAGPVGWLGREEAEFAVGIRSGLLHDQYAHLYTGAGIVAQSDVEAEWQEIENKLANFLRIFHR